MKRGFTLIEIMLALLVVTVGIVAMVGLLSNSLDSSAKSHDDLHAVAFADLVLNYFHSVTNWSEIPPAGPWTVPGYEGGTVNLNDGRFTGQSGEGEYTLTYAFTAASPSPSLKELTLKVWPGFGTNGLPRTFHTEIYNWAKNR